MASSGVAVATAVALENASLAPCAIVVISLARSHSARAISASPICVYVVASMRTPFTAMGVSALAGAHFAHASMACSVTARLLPVMKRVTPWSSHGSSTLSVPSPATLSFWPISNVSRTLQFCTATAALTVILHVNCYIRSHFSRHVAANSWRFSATAAKEPRYKR
jgi:hypothetical protein